MDMNSQFSGVPANGGPVPGQMAYSNGTPPADMSASVPPPGAGPDSPKTTLWYVGILLNDAKPLTIL